MAVEDFGVRIRKARERKGMSQTQLAERVGVGKASISEYESNKTYPLMDNFIKIMEVLEIDPNSVLGFDPPYTNRDDFDLTESQIQAIENLENSIKILRDEFRKANQN